MHILNVALLLLFLWVTGCGGGSHGEASSAQGGDLCRSSRYLCHHEINATIFWIGEAASEANGQIANFKSAWDEYWMQRYGGVDDPMVRQGWYPAAFIPKENPFYVALPYNDFDAQGNRKANASQIPWYRPEIPHTTSLCKNRWVAIEKHGRIAYAQWEDVGPFGEDDFDYVFGQAAPKNTINGHAGIDVSPAVRDYLGIDDIDTVTWRFVDESEVPDGPWKKIVTTTGAFWPLWYRPMPTTRWQWQLQGPIDTQYDAALYDIDLFDTPKETINTLHRLGRKVICYFSAGSYESWREDAGAFPLDAIGKPLEGWEGERWLDIRTLAVRSIMIKRLDLAKRKGCDGVEPDNVDAYLHASGFALLADDQLAYNRFLAKEAHRRGLAIGLKNDGHQAAALVHWFDFVLSESCFAYNECELYRPFLSVAKPLFDAEYDQRYLQDEVARQTLCQKAMTLGAMTLILPLALDGSSRYACWESLPKSRP